MKKKKQATIIQLGILLLLGSLLLFSIVGPNLATLGPKTPLLEISVIIRDVDNSLLENTRLGMEQAAYDLGAELRFLTPTTSNNAEEQHALFLREIEGGSNGIVFIPANPQEFEPLIRQQNLPVVVMESELEPASASICPDNAALGAALADALLQDIAQGGTVLLLDTAPASTGVTARLQQAANTLRQAGMQPVVLPLTPGNNKNFTGAIQQHHAAAVMAFEPAATLWASTALAGAANPPALYGVGNTGAITAALEQGTIAAIAACNEYTAGYLAVQNAVSAAKNTKVHSSLLPFSIIRGEEIYAPENEKLLFPVTK